MIDLRNDSNGKTTVANLIALLKSNGQFIKSFNDKRQSDRRVKVQFYSGELVFLLPL